MKTDIREIEERMEKTGEKIRAIGEELTILSPLKPIAIGMREEFFETFLSGESMGENVDESVSGIKDPSAIWIGDDIEPVADVITDVCMFKKGLIDDNESFTALYGLDWQAAKELIEHPHMVSAMNKRANVLSTASTEWTKESEFNQLRRWTQNATPGELVDFTKDVAGVTYPKQLFLNIMRNS
ncbi:hypothetical protein B9Z19DRAFT_1108818 [Tuber borchii]|uniref:Uncharacterized protein n=1 Tax=Tuber borchii TaxID=42251 RepID=A0A2T6ZPW9_TUBBO|nr:hypothetical protein B9Z19DRAFT_1108818 [Tuber borchii]